MSKNNTEVDILMAVQELEEIKGATVRNILGVAREYNANITMGDVRRALAKGIYDGYILEHNNTYILKQGMPKKPERSCKKEPKACKIPSPKKRRRTPCKSPTPCKKRRSLSGKRKSTHRNANLCANILPDEAEDVIRAILTEDEYCNRTGEDQGSEREQCGVLNLEKTPGEEED